MPSAVVFGPNHPATSRPMPNWPVNARPPSAGQLPGNHRDSASFTLNLSMAGRAGVTWKTHAPWDPASSRLISRRNVWIVGRYTHAGAGTIRFGLHDTGAQHRTKVVWARVHSPDAGARIAELTRVPNPSPTVPPTWVDQGNTPQSANGFFAIAPSRPQIAVGGWLDFDHLYELVFSAPWCELEVFYDQYPVGTITAQLNDGGPPPIPPVMMEN